MKKFYSILKCSILCSSESSTSGESLMCDACTLLLYLSHCFLQSSHLQWIFFPVVGNVWSLSCQWTSLRCLGLVLSDQAFARDTVAPNYKAFFLCCPLRNFIGGQGLWSDQLTTSSPLLVPLSDSLCGYLSLFLGKDPHWNCAGPCWGCLQTAPPVEPPWIGSGQQWPCNMGTKADPSRGQSGSRWQQ